MNLKSIILSTLIVTAVPAPIMASSALTYEEIYNKYEYRRTGRYDINKYSKLLDQEKPAYLRKEIKKNKEFVAKIEEKIEQDSTPELNGMYYTMMGNLFKAREGIFDLLKNVHKDLKKIEEVDAKTCSIFKKEYYEEAINKFETVINVNDATSLREFYEQSSKSSKAEILFSYGLTLRNMDSLTGNVETTYLKKLILLVPILMEKPDIIASLPDEGRRLHKGNYSSAGGNGENIFSHLGYEKGIPVLDSIKLELEKRASTKN